MNNKPAVSEAALRRFAELSTKESAKVENREIPADYVRTPEVQKLLESILAKA